MNKVRQFSCNSGMITVIKFLKIHVSNEHLYYVGRRSITYTIIPMETDSFGRAILFAKALTCRYHDGTFVSGIITVTQHLEVLLDNEISGSKYCIKHFLAG